MDGDRVPNERPTSQLVVRPEDLDRIAAAIRDGLGKEPPDGKKLVRDAVALIAGIAVLSLLYLTLTHWRPAVELSVQANALPSTAVLAYQPEDGDVSWEFGAGQVQALSVAELPPADESDAEQFTLSLPIASADCAAVAAALVATCDGSVIEVQAPVSVAWSVPQPLQLVSTTRRDQGSSRADPVRPLPLKLTLQPGPGVEGMTEEAAGDSADQPASAAPPRSQLTIADQQVASQRWCFPNPPAAAATMSISGGSGSYQRAFERASALDSGCDALQLRITPAAGAHPMPDDARSDSAQATPQPEQRRRASVVTLSGIASLAVTTSSRHMDVSALTGTLRVQQEDVRVFDTATQTVLTADEPIEGVLGIQAGTPSLTVAGHDVTSIDTDRGNLVKTVWQRNPELILPIFLGLVGVLTPVLGAAYRNAVDYIASRRTPEPSG